MGCACQQNEKKPGQSWLSHFQAKFGPKPEGASNHPHKSLVEGGAKADALEAEGLSRMLGNRMAGRDGLAISSWFIY